MLNKIHFVLSFSALPYFLVSIRHSLYFSIPPPLSPDLLTKWCHSWCLDGSHKCWAGVVAHGLASWVFSAFSCFNITQDFFQCHESIVDYDVAVITRSMAGLWTQFCLEVMNTCPQRRAVKALMGLSQSWHIRCNCTWATRTEME